MHPRHLVMIVDLRTYTVAPGKLKAYLEAYEREGYPIHIRYLGEPIGYFTTEVGTLNRVVHLWKYESMAEREQRRAALEVDPDWVAWRRKSAEGGYLVHQENTILTSTRFSPI
ncbi:MAG TPA: NIPSNAP family protein [Candidatus Acidoferrales bacterium]|nr:NIPSNAP family protein [Candidatus Acidoferrales bacterium]